MAIKACWLMTWQKHQFGSLGTGSKISAPRSEVGNSTSFIPGDSQPLAQFGSKMILTNRGRLDRQASEPGDQNMGWKAEEGKYLEQKRGKWYSDKDRAKGNEDEVKEREWDRLSLEFWCQDRLSGSSEQIHLRVFKRQWVLILSCFATLELQWHTGICYFSKRTLINTMESLNTFSPLHSLSLALIHGPIAD